MHYALGVDVGGTKVSVTLGNSRGKILAKEILPTQTGQKTRTTLRQLIQTLKQFLDLVPNSKRPVGIGVGICGPMDPKKGIIQRSPHLQGWAGFPLKGFLEREVKLPVFITNDANAAAVGEKIFGAGRRVENFAYLTISTGIGGGVILNNRLLLGASFGAGEVGHTIIVPGGALCKCGQRGCLEAYASGTAIAQFVRSEIRRGRKSKVLKWVRSEKRITAEVVSLSATEKDRLAVEAFERAGYYLGVGLANLINLLNPERLILGGSVMKSSRFLWPTLMRSVREHAWPTLLRACRIVKTRLGDQVGDLGALALVFARESIPR